MKRQNSVLQAGLDNLVSNLNGLITIIPPCLLILSILLLALNFTRGLDITDECFYILSAQRPEQISGTATQFGFYTGILFRAVSENLFLYRLAGLSILLVLTGVFVFYLGMYQSFSNPGKRNHLTRLCRACVILSGTLSYYKEWLVTPSYNFLALSGILITLTALIGGALAASKAGYFHTTRQAIRLAPWAVIVGIGGGLGLMAKPTSALVLAMAALFWIFASSIRRYWFGFLTVASFSAVAFVVLHILFFESSFQFFWVKLQTGVLWSKLLGSGHTLTDVTVQAFTAMKKLPGTVFRSTGLGLLVIACALVFRTPDQQDRARLNPAVVSIILIFLTVVWLLILKSGYWAGGAETAKRITWGGLAFLANLVVIRLFFVNSWWVEVKTGSKTSGSDEWILVLLLLAGSMAYSFGSNIGFIKNMSASMIFIFAACIAMAARLDSIVTRDAVSRLVSVLLSVSIFLILQDAYAHPQRIPGGIASQVEPATLLGTSGKIFVDPQTKQYIRKMQDLAVAEHWVANTPLIDLTGGTPGAAVILGAEVPGTPWLIGGYPGSEQLVTAVLEKCEKARLEQAWVLTAPGGERSVPEAILGRIGLDFPAAYKKVGTLTTSYRNESQILWKKQTPGTQARSY